jgi:hypothetical protein
MGFTIQVPTYVLFVNVLNSISGDLHHRVYVFRFSEAVPETHEAQRKEVTIVRLEALVFSDTFRP